MNAIEIKIGNKTYLAWEALPLPNKVEWEYAGPAPTEFEFSFDSITNAQFELALNELDVELEAILTGTYTITWRNVFDETMRLSAWLEHERTRWWELPVLWERKQ